MLIRILSIALFSLTLLPISVADDDANAKRAAYQARLEARRAVAMEKRRERNEARVQQSIQAAYTNFAPRAVPILPGPTPGRAGSPPQQAWTTQPHWSSTPAWLRQPHWSSTPAWLRAAPPAWTRQPHWSSSPAWTRQKP